MLLSPPTIQPLDQSDSEYVASNFIAVHSYLEQHSSIENARKFLARLLWLESKGVERFEANAELQSWHEKCQQLCPEQMQLRLLPASTALWTPSDDMAVKCQILVESLRAWSNAPKMPPDHTVPVKHTEGPSYYTDKSMERRDQFIYESYKSGMTNHQLIVALEVKCRKNDWFHITTHQGIRDAVNRYIRNTSATALAPKRGGRPKRQNPQV